MYEVWNNRERLINIDFPIPAYDINHQGLLVHLILKATPCSQFRIKSSGSIAESLEKNFIRVIKIMSSLKKDWDCLEAYDYTFMSFDENYNVQDTRSADLSLSITALNIVRNHFQQNPINRYIGTGSLRIDGSFNKTFLEEVKEEAVLQADIIQKSFVTARHCNHIFHLEELLNSC